MTSGIVPPKLRLPALALLLNVVIAIPPPTLGQSPPTLKLRLKVTSSSAFVAKGLNLALHAAHVFPNGSTADLTRRAIWMSSNPQIAIVSNLATKQGTVTGVNPGVVTITAISGPERGSLNVTVTGPAIVAITVTPPNDSVAVSGAQPFTAIASFSDQSTPQDITNTAAWSSTPNANMSGRTANGVTPGIATITALDPASKVTGRTSLNVGLGSIAVTPANPSIPLGTTQQFTAMGNFNNGSPVSIAVQWISSLPQAVTVSPSGLAQSLTTGTATITATSGLISGSTMLHVGPAIPKFIAVRPSNGNIGIGATLQFSAAQIYTDGSIAPLPSASWSSSLPAVAGIDPAKGLLTAFSPGTTTITATSGSLTGSATLSVSFTRFAYLSNAIDGTVSIYSVGPAGQWRDHGYVLLGANVQPRTPATTPAGAFLYVPQSGAGSIAAFAIDGSGNLSALPGSPFASGIAPNQVVVAPNGQFAYVPNSGSGTISQYSIDSTGALLGMTPATVPAGMHPAFLAIEPSGKFLYSADTGSSTVTFYSIDQSSGALGPLGTIPSGGSSPQSLAIDPTGSFLLVANSGVSGAGTIASFAINPATGVLTPAPGSPFNAGGGAESITIDPEGKYAYTANGGSNTVSAFHIGSNGALTAIGSPPAAPGNPNAVRVDVSGTQLYAVRSQLNELSTFSIDATTGALTALRGTRTRNSPYDLAMTTGQPMHYLPKFALVSFSNANLAETFAVNANSGALSSLPVSSASEGPAVTDYSGAASVAADPSGSFAYVANQASAEVFGYGINPNSGVLAAVANSPAAAGPVLKQLAVEASGRFIYAVNCADTHNVHPYTLQNLALTAISGANAGSCPFAVATDPTGRFVYVANFVDSTISTFSIDPATGVLQQIGSPLMSARPTGITVHPSGKFAYVINTPCSCPGTIQIFTIDALTGALSGGNTILSVGLNPAAVTLDPDGKFLYVVDFGGVDSTTNAAPILPGDITAFAVNENTGNLTPITGSPYMVAYSADGVSIEPSGKFLYLTIRGDVGNHYPDAISVFSIDPQAGQLNIPETMTFSPPGQGPSSIVVTGAIQ